MAEQLRICSVCGYSGPRFDPGPGRKRLDVTCPSCRSLERHRFLAQLIDVIAPRVVRPTGVTVDVAPEPCTAPRLAGFGPVVSVDLDSRVRKVDIVGDLTRLPLADSVANLLICYHVLEHIPDDRAAMREIARVLAPHGVAVLQVPARPRPTDEDPGATLEERIERFGQADHVRYYGIDDFSLRLTESGLRVRVLRMADMVPGWMIEHLRLHEGETVWLCSRADQPEPEVLQHIPELWPESLRYVFEAMARRSYDMSVRADRATDRVRSLRRSRRKLRRERDSWRRQYRRLRRRRSVKLGLWLADRARRLGLVRTD